MRDRHFWDFRFLSVTRMLQLVANFYLLFYTDVVQRHNESNRQTSFQWYFVDSQGYISVMAINVLKCSVGCATYTNPIIK